LVRKDDDYTPTGRTVCLWCPVDNPGKLFDHLMSNIKTEIRNNILCSHQQLKTPIFPAEYKTEFEENYKQMVSSVEFLNRQYYNVTDIYINVGYIEYVWVDFKLKSSQTISSPTLIFLWVYAHQYLHNKGTISINMHRFYDGSSTIKQYQQSKPQQITQSSGTFLTAFFSTCSI
jgi:hypothetical protein